MSGDDYVRQVHGVVKVRDGDTYLLDIDLGYRITARFPVRLYPYDTPETRTTSCPECHLRTSPYEKREGIRAGLFVKDWLAARPLLFLNSHGSDPDGAYGRWLGDLWSEDPTATLGDALHTAGLSTVWPTRWHHVYDATRDQK